METDSDLLSVGSAAARLGVAPATVRSWERRYGLGPAGRSSGGHRRYTAADLAVLLRMQQLFDAGLSPAAAAREALAERSGRPPGECGAEEAEGSDLTGTGNQSADGIEPAVGPRLRRRSGGPGGRVLAVPGASDQVRGLARAASRLDDDSIAGQLGDLLVHHGVAHTWDAVLRPVFRAVGHRWARSGDAIEVEHLLSEVTVEALRAYRAFLPKPAAARPVLLASGSADQHTLPLHVLAAALTERHLPARLMGGRLPGAAVGLATRRTGAVAVFVWRQLRPPADDEEGSELARLPMGRTVRAVVVGGPGWDSEVLPAGVRQAHDLSSAMQLLAPGTP
jgi:DNA-binding transcriptional MerR regulator